MVSASTGQAGTRPEDPIREGKYARVERERRFLLTGPKHDDPDGHDRESRDGDGDLATGSHGERLACITPLAG